MLISLARLAAPRRLLTLFTGLLCAGMLTACAPSTMETLESRGEITLGRSDTAVVIENRAGRPALNVRITINAGDAGLFFAVIPTMETAERRTIPFQMFRTEDGSLFSAGTGTPTEVILEGKDTLNNDYKTTMPWERGR